MRSRPLAVAGAVEFTPEVHADERGHLLMPFQGPVFEEAVGHRLFPVVQSGFSSSRRGVVRGPHFTRVGRGGGGPSGSAKYVYAPQGSVLDVVVDVRVGSPTFGRWDAVVLGGRPFRAVYLPVGTAHMFVALRDDSIVHYLMSSGYAPRSEFALSAFDPVLRLPIPEDIEPVLSERDRAAPSLAELESAGVLPRHQDCLRVEAGFAAPGAHPPGAPPHRPTGLRTPRS